MDDFENNILNAIKNTIEEQIDREYTEFKLMYLDNLEYTLEKRRNDVVKSILNTIDIRYLNDTGSIPSIQINIIKNDKEDNLWKID